jgi:5-methylcytosine-specific restriction enzyme subunit McrC
MRQIDLQEWRSSSHHLSIEQRDALRDLLSSDKLSIEPVSGTGDEYRLRPASTIGAVDIGDMSVSIRPKLPIGRVLYLASYAMGEVHFREERFDFEGRKSLVEALVPALVRAARRAFGRGLLHGYRTEEEALHTVRGRIRVADQIRHRFGVPVPVEVRYDDFTDDVLPNQLVKAAAVRLGKLRIRSPQSRLDLGWIAATLDNVSLVDFPPGRIPEVKFDRLNEHYREVVTLARLILRHASIETTRGGVRASGFLMDMNKIFEEFVTRALRERLRLTEHTLAARREVWLDVKEKVRMEPDLSWWDDSGCIFVGDVKYKTLESKPVRHADLYQPLAYTTALDLPGGVLIYAEGEQPDACHDVLYAGKRLVITSLDLSGSINELHDEISKLASRVEALQRQAA